MLKPRDVLKFAIANKIDLRLQIKMVVKKATVCLVIESCGLRLAIKIANCDFNLRFFGQMFSCFQGPLNGGVSNGGVSRSGLVLPFLSFLGLSRIFWDFPDLLGDGPGIFPISPFPLSRPIQSTYEEQSRKGPRHNLDLSRKKSETPGFGNPPV